MLSSTRYRATVARADRPTVRDRRVQRLCGRLRSAGRRPVAALVAAEGDVIRKARLAAQAPVFAASIDLIDDQVAAALSEVLAIIDSLGIDLNAVLSESGLAEALGAADLTDVEEWIDEMLARFATPVGTAVESGFASGLASLDLDLDYLVDDVVLSTIEAINAQATSFPQTIASKIDDAIFRGIQADETTAQLVARLEGVAPSLLPWKAEQIARTSGGGGFTAGRHKAFKEADISAKIWRSVLAGKSRRQGHLAMHGEEVPIDEVFSNGLRYPRDPESSDAGEVVNCECFLEPVA